MANEDIAEGSAFREHRAKYLDNREQNAELCVEAKGISFPRSHRPCCTVIQAPSQHHDLSENSFFLLERFLVRGVSQGISPRFQLCKMPHVSQLCQVSPVKWEEGPNLAFISLSHSKVLKLFNPVTSFLPLLKAILITSEPYFPTTAFPQAFPFLKTARTQRVQFESKRDIFPTNTATSQGYSAVCLLFCHVAFPHISHHAPVQPQRVAPAICSMFPAHPPHLIPQWPISQCPARAPSDCQAALLAASPGQDRECFPWHMPADRHKVRAAALAACMLTPRN